MQIKESQLRRMIRESVIQFPTQKALARRLQELRAELINLYDEGDPSMARQGMSSWWDQVDRAVQHVKSATGDDMSLFDDMASEAYEMLVDGQFHPENVMFKEKVPVRSVSGDDIASMIDVQLSNLVHKNGDPTYRDNFLTSLNRQLRVNAVKEYIKYVAREIRENQDQSPVAAIGERMRGDMEELFDMTLAFLENLAISKNRIEDMNLNRYADEVDTQLERMGYGLMS